jgi:MFS family permease
MRLLARRDFLLIFLAFALSSFGDYLALVTLSLRIEQQTGSAWAVAALLLTGLVPAVALAPVAGLLVDRLENVRLIVLVAMGQAAVAALLAFTPGVAPTLLLSLLLGAGLAVTHPALFAILPRAVGEERIGEANAYLEAARWGGAAIGPLAAAAMSSAFGARTTLLANAVTFLAVAALGPLLRVRRRPVPGDEAEPSARGAARRGIAHIAADPLLRLLVPMIGLMVVFAAADNVAELFFAVDVLDAGRTAYGILVTTWTLGMVLGSATARWLPRARMGAVVPPLAMLGGGAVIVAAVGATLPLATAMFLVGGMSNGAQLVAMRTLLHRRVPDSLRGRAFAAYYGMIQAAQILALSASGGLVELAGARTTMIIAGGGTVGVGLVGSLLYLRVPTTQRDVVAVEVEGSSG